MEILSFVTIFITRPPTALPRYCTGPTATHLPPKKLAKMVDGSGYVFSPFNRQTMRLRTENTDENVHWGVRTYNVDNDVQVLQDFSRFGCKVIHFFHCLCCDLPPALSFVLPCHSAKELPNRFVYCHDLANRNNHHRRGPAAQQ